MYAIIEEETRRIVSITSDANHSAANGYQAVELPGDFDESAADEYVLNDKGALVRDASLRLARARTAAIAAIKAEAARAIDALAWRLERARERDSMALDTGGERVSDVLAAREAIRRASNRTEAAILAAETPEAVATVTLEITDDDIVQPAALTREQFLSRLTPEETAAILTAAKSNVALEAFVLRLTTASYINVTDLATEAGVQALEIAGLLASGRAEQILALPE